MRESPARDALDAHGIDAVCEAVADGKTLTAIAQDVGVSIGSLSAWLDADPERSARAREARKATARMWDEKAEQRLDSAADPFELAKARELASHFRWRASKIAPGDYGDRLTTEHTGPGGGPVQVADVSGEALDARIAALREELGL